MESFISSKSSRSKRQFDNWIYLWSKAYVNKWTVNDIYINLQMCQMDARPNATTINAVYEVETLNIHFYFVN